MTCNCCGAERLFNLKAAKKELKKYKKSGPGKATRALIKAMGSSELKEKTLLDIGGGIGALQWYFLKNGGSKTTDLDYSNGYLKVAEEYALENNWGDQSTFRQGDFLEESESIDKHDFVALDKVVCCYPEYQKLLTLALGKCDHTFCMVYPLGGSISKLVVFFVTLFLRVMGNPFRPYIHSVDSIRHLILEAGFVSVHTSVSFPWHVEVYRRV